MGGIAGEIIGRITLGVHDSRFMVDLVASFRILF